MSQSDPDAIAFCPRCSSRLRIKQSSVGKTIGCAKCKCRFVARVSLGLDDESSGDYTAPPVSAPPEEERIEIPCPECSAELSVRKVYIGQHVRCRKCNHKFVVPSLSVPAIPPSLESHVGPGRFDALELLARLSGQSSLGHLQDALHDLRSARAEPRDTHALLQAKCDGLARERDELAAERARLILELNQANEDRAQLADTLSQIKVDHERLLEVVTSLREQIDQLQADRGQRDLEAASDLEVSAAVESRIEALVAEASRSEPRLHDSNETDIELRSQGNTIENELDPGEITDYRPVKPLRS